MSLSARRTERTVNFVMTELVRHSKMSWGEMKGLGKGWHGLPGCEADPGGPGVSVPPVLPERRSEAPQIMF